MVITKLSEVVKNLRFGDDARQTRHCLSDLHKQNGSLLTGEDLFT